MKDLHGPVGDRQGNLVFISRDRGSRGWFDALENGPETREIELREAYETRKTNAEPPQKKP
jgi:hypothetical protein